MAPVKAPLRWPNNSDSRRFSGSALQFTGTKGENWRRLLKWSALATSSLPVPLSPRIRIVLSVSARRSIILNTSCLLAELPEIWVGRAEVGSEGRDSSRESSATCTSPDLVHYVAEQ